MKNNVKFPVILIVTGLFVLFSNVIVISYVLINIFMKHNVQNNYIWGIFLLIVISSLQLFVSRGVERTSEVSARFMLDSLPAKQMAIEIGLDLDTGRNMTKEEADNKKLELQKEIDFFGPFNGSSKLFSTIIKIQTIGLLCVVILLITINGLKLFAIEDKYITTIISCGIISQLILLLTSLYTGVLPLLKQPSYRQAFKGDI
jgi:flagellar biosynthesis protein FlhA